VERILRDKRINVNQKTNEMGESPLFFALGKLKDKPSEKIKMVKLLLQHEEVDVSLLNNEKKACYEVCTSFLSLLGLQ